MQRIIFRNLARPVKFFLSIFVILSGFGISSAVVGQEIYKSVDDDGNVIYSDKPLKNVEETTIMQPVPEPSAEEVEAANQQRQQLVDDTNMKVQEYLQQESQQQSTTDAIITEVETQGVDGVDGVGRRGERKVHQNRSHRRR